MDDYTSLDAAFVPLDRAKIKRTKNLTRIPLAPDRRGGKAAYAEWAHVIGIFQTLIRLHLERAEPNRILDVGCGTGLLAIASEPFLGQSGEYVGIDVMSEDIAFCQRHYPNPPFSFVHLNVRNAAYAPDQDAQPLPWPLPDASFDLVTALSVWTHFAEADARLYIKEAARVLRPGAHALVSCFLLDETYRRTLTERRAGNARFHASGGQKWIFDKPAYASSNWFTAAWTPTPEQAIAFTEEALRLLATEGGLSVKDVHIGHWKEVPGLFMQDIVVFQKSA